MPIAFAGMFALLTWTQPLMVNEPAWGTELILLREKKNKPMEKAVARASQEGYELVSAAMAFDDTLHLLFQKSATEGLTYHFLVETDHKRLKGRINTLAEEGFRLRSDSLLQRGKLLGNNQFIALMEKKPGTPHYEYLTLISEMGDPMRNTIAKARKLGYEVKAMLTLKDNQIGLIVEKLVKAAE